MSNNKRLWIILAVIFSCFLIFKPLRKKLFKSLHFSTYTLNMIERSFNSHEINNSAERKFYIINLATSPARMAAATAQAEKYGIKLERFEATNGAKITIVNTQTDNSFLGIDLKQNSKLFVEGQKYNIYCDQEALVQKQPDFLYIPGKKDFIMPSDRELSPGEIGLNCSARRLWMKIAAAKDDQLAVIFEDDVLLSDNFDKKLDEVFKLLPKKWDYVYLGYSAWNYLDQNDDKNGLSLDKDRIDNKLLKLEGDFSVSRTHAYIINKPAAEKMIQIQQKHYTSKPLDGVLDEATRSHRVNSYVVEAKIAGADTDFDSDLWAVGSGK